MSKYVNAWKAIKNGYEKTTGKAKPSAKAKSFFSKPSAIEPACKTVDAVLAATIDASLPAKATAAGDALLTKADAYAKSVASQASSETDKTTKDAMTAMEAAILKLVKDARDELEGYVEPVFVGSFKNQLPTAFGSAWLVERMPMQGFTPERKLIIGLDMCKAQLVANPYKFQDDKRKYANFHRQVDAAIDGTTSELTKAIQSAKDPRHGQLKRAMQGYIDLMKPIKQKNQLALQALITKAKTDQELAKMLKDLAII